MFWRQRMKHKHSNKRRNDFRHRKIESTWINIGWNSISIQFWFQCHQHHNIVYFWGCSVSLPSLLSKCKRISLFQLVTWFTQQNKQTYTNFCWILKYVSSIWSDRIECERKTNNICFAVTAMFICQKKR